MAIDEWKVKYQDLKQKFLSATDVAYRLGYEQGSKETQMEMQAQQMQQQMEQQMAMQQQMQQGGGMPPVDEQGNPIDPSQMSPEEQQMLAEQQQGGMPMEEGDGEGAAPEINPEVSAQLDEKIAELESLVAKGESRPSVKEIRKTLGEIKDLRKSQHEKAQKKAQKTISAQKAFVDAILSKWSDETKSLTDELEETILKEGIELED